jgi:hypothetical protein
MGKPRAIATEISSSNIQVPKKLQTSNIKLAAAGKFPRAEDKVMDKVADAG